MEYNRLNVNNYNIHTINIDKFKTIKMEIVFTRKVNKDEMPSLTFLSDLMSDSSKKYPSRKDMSIKLEDLYKTYFYSTTNKIGNMFFLSFVVEFIDPKYIKERSYLDNIFKFVFDVINNPNINNNEFDKTNFNIVKKRMEEEIDSVNESSERKAIYNSLEKMDNTSSTSYSILGTKTDINKITSKSLINTYNDLINNSNLDIFIIGNIDKDIYTSLIKKYNTFNNKKNSKISLDVKNKLRNKVLKVEESSLFSQSTLVMIYNISKLTKKNKDIDFYTFNYLLNAGGINSKLYKYLRVDNSLCYGVRSIYFKYDGLLMVVVSLDDSNVSKATRLIKKAIKELSEGKISDEELALATKNMIFSLKTRLDNNTAILDNYLFNYIDNLPLINQRIELISKVSKSDVVKCAKSLKLNTIYISKGDTHEEN